MAAKLTYDVSARRVTPRQLELFAPYLLGEEPRKNGEWDMFCPLHEDTNRSSSLNVKNGKWHCNKGCPAGNAAQLVRMKDQWVDPPAGGGAGNGGRSSQPSEVITEAKVAGWASALLGNKQRLRAFRRERGLSTEMIKRFQIGWDVTRDCYVIPVRSDDGGFWNARRYVLEPEPGRRKIWGVEGLNSPRLFPVQILEENPEEIVICEGELDSLITIQNGFPAITRTAAAKVWNDGEWNHHFKDKVVYLAHDADETGVAANNALELKLRKVAKAIYIIELPYPIVPKHGKDVTDFFKEHTADDFRNLMAEARERVSAPEPIDLDPANASILETFDSRRVGQPMSLVVTIKGKQEPGYSVPRRATLRCTMDKGNKCNHCPLLGAGGRATVEIKPGDADVLGLMDANKYQVTEQLREKYGALKCEKIELEVDEHQAVEVLHARPSVDHVKADDRDAANYISRRIISVGRHDTPTNSTVKITGALHPDPRRQKNEFLAWDVDPQQTSLDSFEVTPELVQKLKVFQPKRGQRPISKRLEVVKDLSKNVTNIVQSDELHLAFDLMYHSLLTFDLDGSDVGRGYVEILIAGDTRTGKSEVGKRLLEHYQAGELISGESASFAGIIGGLQQYGDSGEWVVNWGVLPINDRRAVIIDEISSMAYEDIGKMSSVRSSGEAKIQKVSADYTMARCRAAWLGNPRKGKMGDYTFGVDALLPLIGSPEDLARFDLAMTLKKGEVASEVINRTHKVGDPEYSSELCHTLVMWAWSRKREHVKFTPKAIKAIYKHANELGKRYVEEPPLIQAANARVKIARLAASLAAMTFSTDATGEQVIIREQHIKDTITFIDRVYGKQSFGYLQRSQEQLNDEKYARSMAHEARVFLGEHKGLAKFLRGQSRFKRQDVEEIMSYSRDLANGVITELYKMRMIRKEGGFTVVEPALHDLLRERDVE